MGAHACDPSTWEPENLKFQASLSYTDKAWEGTWSSASHMLEQSPGFGSVIPSFEPTVLKYPAENPPLKAP